ncbi:MAG: sensor histidine kinase [Pleomorphochaeta sp.]
MKQKHESIFFSVGNQINLFLVAIFIIVVVFSFFVRTTMFDYIIKSSSNNNLSYKVLSLKTNISDCEESLNMYLRSGNRQKLNEFNIASENSKDIIEDLIKSVNDRENLYLLKSIETSFNNYFFEGCQASFNYNTNNYEYYSKMYQAEIIHDYLQKYCDELLNNLIEEEKMTNEILDNNFSKYSTFLIIFLTAFFIFLLAVFVHIYTNISHPLILLVHEAKRVSKGDFEVKARELKRDNSMSLLIRTFNNMITNIKNMMEELNQKVIIERELAIEQKKNEENLKLLNEAQFLALQSQTNPHFLFNTLNSISRMITLEKNDDSLIMIDSLSALLRYNLSDASKPVLLKEELDITTEYIKIQQKRFNHRLKYYICVPIELQNEVMLPKFTLQPIIENAIVHGLEPKKEGGIIKISAKLEENDVIIEIEDNGVGVKDKVLEKFNNYEDIECENRKHLGLSNTRSRIELFTNNKKSFEMIKKKSGGTKIIIKLKADMEVKDNV